MSYFSVKRNMDTSESSHKIDLAALIILLGIDFISLHEIKWFLFLSVMMHAVTNGFSYFSYF